MTSATTAARLFRLNIEVESLQRAVEFYSALLGQEGAPQMGSRCYFRAGTVTLQVVEMPQPQTCPKALYFVVDDLAEYHRRAKELDGLSDAAVHGTPAGDIVVRPWGERSFYCFDPSRNPLCFVEEGTIYAG